jgi:hypothetical protein
LKRATIPREAKCVEAVDFPNTSLGNRTYSTIAMPSNKETHRVVFIRQIEGTRTLQVDEDMVEKETGVISNIFTRVCSAVFF